MPGFRSSENLLRDRDDEAGSSVARIELFFDLVFVFAVAQLSHTLLDRFTPLGGLEVFILLLAVWWLWISTTWATNILNAIQWQVRALIIAIMFGGLVLSSTIPDAFGSRALAFALALTVIQVGRSLFAVWALRDHHPRAHAAYVRITIRLAMSSVLWIGGALADGELRIGLWLLAILVDYSAPLQGFWVPGLGRSSPDDWDVDDTHMAERCGLFVIVALGESILLTGDAFYELPQTPAVIGAFVSAFVASVAMWGIYFQTGSRWAEGSVEESDDPGRLAQFAYTYFHLPIVAGIIVTAVADDLVLSHVLEPPDGPTIIASIAGPSLFLLGTFAFKWSTTGRIPWAHAWGVGGLLVLWPITPWITTLTLGIVSTTIVVLVAGREVLATRRAGERGEITGNSTEVSG